MAQSLSKVYIHLIFSSKNRERLLRDEIRPDLHAYLGGILRDLDSPCIEITPSPIMPTSYSSFPGPTLLATSLGRQNEAPRHG